MWRTKIFETRQAMEDWIEVNESLITWREVFVVDVPCALEYKLLREM